MKIHHAVNGAEFAFHINIIVASNGKSFIRAIEQSTQIRAVANKQTYYTRRQIVLYAYDVDRSNG